MTRQKLLQLGWEVLIPLRYSPDIAPSDFHLFRSSQNSLNEKKSELTLENTQNYSKVYSNQMYAESRKR